MAPKKAKPFAETLAGIRMKCIPSAKSVHLWKGTIVYQPLLVLVDAVIEKVPARDLIALLDEIDDDGWHALRRRVRGIWWPDEFASQLRLPSWDRIEEINSDEIWRDARSAVDSTLEGWDESEEFYAAERAAQDALYKQWAMAIEAAADPVLEQYSLVATLTDDGLVVEHGGSNGRTTWKTCVDAMEQLGCPARGTESHREYTLFYLDTEFPAFEERSIRRRYDNAF